MVINTLTIALRKLREASNPLHPNNIEDGRVERIAVFKSEFKKPTIGEGFMLMGLGRWFCTSAVKEIIDNKTFRTLNSIYEWEILPNKD